MAFDEREVRFDLRHGHSELNDFGGRTLQRDARPTRRIGMDARRALKQWLLSPLHLPGRHDTWRRRADTL